MPTNSNKNGGSVNPNAPMSSPASRSHRHVQEVIERIFARRNASVSSRRHPELDNESPDSEFHRR